jgi:hypothetical protein
MKPTKPRRLALRSEDIRQLSAVELGAAHGGEPDWSIVYDCPTNASRCERSCFSSCKP